MTETVIPPENAWEAWHPTQLAAKLSAVTSPWYVVGGWALDLWHGQQTRQHEDLEFAVLRDDLSKFRDSLTGLQFYAVRNGKFRLLAHDEQPGSDVEQIWCWDVAAKRWRADMMIDPGTTETWVYKRDDNVRSPRSEAIANDDVGISYLGPSRVLLFKAKHLRDKDRFDFENAVIKLTRAELDWLCFHLERLHPGHEWLDRLRPSATRIGFA